MAMPMRTFGRFSHPANAGIRAEWPVVTSLDRSGRASLSASEPLDVTRRLDPARRAVPLHPLSNLPFGFSLISFGISPERSAGSGVRGPFRAQEEGVVTRQTDGGLPLVAIHLPDRLDHLDPPWFRPRLARGSGGGLALGRFVASSTATQWGIEHMRSGR
jgi:hypothetical protein